MTFPAAGGNYNVGGWTTGAPIAGTATDATSGISGAGSIHLTITQTAGGFTWNGSSFVSGAHMVNPTTYNTGTGAWTYTFPNTNFPADGSYSVAVTATDAAGNTSAASTNNFKYDTAPPAVAVTFPAAGGNYNAAGWTTGAPIAGTATDATSGISGASSINLMITQTAGGFTWNGQFVRLRGTHGQSHDVQQRYRRLDLHLPEHELPRGRLVHGGSHRH